jgi:hypothetical protein
MNDISASAATARRRTRPWFRTPAWQWRATSLVAVCVSFGCDWDWNHSRSEPPRIQPQSNATPANTPLPLSRDTNATDNARPSTDENMGRSFQGAIELSLRNAAGEQRGLRYLSRGNTARLQIDGVRGQGAFDALIWDENLSIIDNGRRTFRTFALDDVKTDAKTRHVRVDKTGERRVLNGVECERYELEDGALHVSACVTGLSGTFALDKFEKVSGIAVPAWAEELIDTGYMPLQASARDQSGREVYRLDLTRYTAGSVDDSMVALPSNYRAEEGNAIR